MSLDKDKSPAPASCLTFQRIFGQENNKDIFIRFINDVVDHPELGYIAEATYLDNKIANKAPNVVIAHCLDQYEQPYLVEIHLIKDPEGQRNTSSDEVYSELLKEHQGQKVRFVFITILERTLFPPTQQEVRTSYKAQAAKVKNNFIKDFYAVIVELPKFQKTVGELVDRLDCWYYFLKHELKERSEVYPELVERHPIMKRVHEALDQQ